MRELTVHPLPGGFRRSSGYGYRTNPVTGRQGTFHRGVDYAAPAGTPIRAPFDGVVTTGYEAGGAGNWIWVQSGQDLFKSFHHAGFQVKSGPVKAGDVIAYIGTTGSSTGPHAHLELWENGRNIDPTGFLDRAPLKESQPAPVPRPGVQEEAVSVILWTDQAAYLVNGVFKRHINPAELDFLHKLGVRDLGKQPEWLACLTEVPRNMIAGV